MVKVVSPGHAERDPFPVGAVELVGFVVGVQVGRDARLLFFARTREADVWRREEK